MGNPVFRMYICGFCAGAVNGLFGAGGGMVLVPLLTALTDLGEEEIFPASISIIFPLCCVSIAMSAWLGTLHPSGALPYLIGGGIGGLIAGKTAGKIPATWLHKGLGILILWGGIRYLC